MPAYSLAYNNMLQIAKSLIQVNKITDFLGLVKAVEQSETETKIIRAHLLIPFRYMGLCWPTDTSCFGRSCRILFVWSAIFHLNGVLDMMTISYTK